MNCNDCKQNSQIIKEVRDLIDNMNWGDAKIVTEIFSKYISKPIYKTIKTGNLSKDYNKALYVNASANFLNLGNSAQDLSTLKSLKNKYAMGGQVPVEVEGGEVAETPFGNLLGFNGPNHDRGGIKTSLTPKYSLLFL